MNIKWVKKSGRVYGCHNPFGEDTVISNDDVVVNDSPNQGSWFVSFEGVMVESGGHIRSFKSLNSAKVHAEKLIRGRKNDRKPSKISWIDSAGMPSHVHLTNDGVSTLCDWVEAEGPVDPSDERWHAFYIANRKLAKSPNRTGGRSNYCRTCFMGSGDAYSHGLPWDSRCEDVVWEGPNTAPSVKEA